MRKLAHLARRFFRSVVARPPSPEEEDWVAEHLTVEELALWRRMPRYDRAHTVGVARAVEASLAGTEHARGPWPAAALLHDVGKIESGIGLLGRVAGTVLGAVLTRPRVARWSGRRGYLGGIGRYIDHGAIGARLIREAGGREPVARWAEEHHHVRHHPERAPDIPAPVMTALLAADDD